jgi:type IV secretion system protein VirB5
LLPDPLSTTLALTSTYAWAQIPVTDGGSIAQLVQQVATAKGQLDTLQQSYNTAQQTYQQVLGTYRMLTSFANPNGMAQGLLQPFVQNPFPSTSGLPGMITGSTSFAGTVGTLGSLAQQFGTLNRAYTPSGSDGTATRLNQQATSIANMLGIATQNLQSMQQRASGLQSLQAQLDTASDLQTVTSINARIGIEQNYIQTQAAQATTLQTAAQMQLAAVQAQAEQKQRQDADSLFANTKAVEP